MDTNHALRANGVLDTLYNWLFDANSSPTPTSTFIARSTPQSILPPFHDKLGATSEDTFLYLNQPPRSWSEWDPIATLHSILWNYTPDVHALHSKLRSCLEKYGLDARVFLIMAVPFAIWLFLVASVAMGAGHVSEVTPPPSRVPTSNDVKSITHSSEIVPSLSKKARKKKRGKRKKQHPVEALEQSSDTSTQQAHHSQDLSSWSTMLGSAGFFGGQMMDYDPIDISAPRHEKPLRPQTQDPEGISWEARMGAMGFIGGQALDYNRYKHLKEIDRAVKSPNTEMKTVEASRAGDDAVKTSNLGAPESASNPGHTSLDPTPALSNDIPHRNRGQQETDGITLSDSSSFAAFIEPNLTSTTSESATKATKLRTRSTHANSNNSNSGGALGQRDEKLKDRSHHTRAEIGRDLGSRISGYAQKSQLLKNMDTLSGGILGTAVAAAAALATTAEAKAGIVKDKLPNSVTDFAEDLRESFDHLMQADPNRSRESDSEPWGIRQAVTQILDYDSKAAIWYKESVSRKSSIDHLSFEPSYTPPPTAMQGSPIMSPKAEAAAAAEVEAEVKKWHTDDVFPTGDYSDYIEPDTAAIDEGFNSSDNDGIVVSCNTSRSRAHSVTEDSFPELVAALNMVAAKEESPNVPVIGFRPAPALPAPATASPVPLIVMNGKDDGGDSVNGSTHHHHDHSHHTHHLVVHPHDEFDSRHHRRHSNGKLSPLSMEIKAEEPMQEYTLDEHGNKVAVVDVRRDSGFDMLS